MSEPEPAAAAPTLAVADTLSATPSSPSSNDLAQDIARGTVIGRYVVLGKIGAGAMGVVIAALDPELDRKVAIKVLKPRGDSPDDDHTRLHREARALAKLDHRNVVSVFDVGVHDGQLFLAMEFIEGTTLREWMRASPAPRPWPDVVRVFTDAGEGLAAAHGTGLIHRDFKPDNVMIGRDGRVRVMDFGLARANPERDFSFERSYQDIRKSDTHALVETVTETGALVGTPAYMAPELFDGLPANSRTDQFAFCVALYEALYGERPFAGLDLPRLREAVQAERIRPAPRGSKVPKWLRAIVLRGLAREPTARFGNMLELLAALHDGARRRRRVLGFAASAAVVALATGGFAEREWRAAREKADCEAIGDSIDDIWNADSRAAVRAGLVATGISYAPTAADKLMPWLDRQAEDWREHATFACMQAEVDDRWDAATYAKVSWCLDQHKVELELLIGELSTANAGVVEAAVSSAANLSLVATCTDERSLATLPEPPAPELRTESADIQRELLRAVVLENAGSFEAALEVNRAALSRAEALGWDHLTSAVRGHEALLLAQIGSYAEAEAVGTAAYMQAAESGNWEVAATAAARLAVVVGVDQQRPVEGKIWAEREALVALRHIGDPFQLREVLRVSSLALIHWRNGDLEQSKRLQERALELQIAALGPEHPNVAATLLNLGATRRALGDYREAREMYEEAIAISERLLGPEHPQLASCHNNLGYLLTTIDEHKAAVPIYEKALAIQRQTLGTGHPTYANTLGNLGLGHAELGDVDQGEQMVREALSTFERALGPDHPAVASTHINLAHVLVLAGRFEEAENELGVARATLERSLGPQHSSLVDVWIGFGELHAARGELGPARDMLERALNMQEQSLGLDHPVIATTLHELGTIHEKLGELERARELYECALAIREGSEGSAADLAETRAALSRIG